MKSRQKKSDMSNTEAFELARLASIDLWYPDLHSSKDNPYPLPQIIFRTPNRQVAEDIATKYSGVYTNPNNPNIVWVKKAILVRAFLERMMSLLNKRKARIALDMLDITKNKRKVLDWKEKLRSLGRDFKETSDLMS
jgi:hypothetical protein